MPSASAVAKFILSLADEDAGELISNLKLQKLLYYAQGFHLAMHSEALFPEQIRAWEHGPVVPQVWQEYRDHGAGAIPRPAEVPMNEFTGAQAEVIKEVYAVFGQFSAWKLRNMTHDETPWTSTARDGVIAHEKMSDYFTSQLTEDAN